MAVYLLSQRPALLNRGYIFAVKAAWEESRPHTNKVCHGATTIRNKQMAHLIRHSTEEWAATLRTPMPVLAR